MYPKLSQSYFLLLECLAQDHMAFLSTLDPSIFLYIIKSISEGLAAEGMTNLTSSDATGDLSADNFSNSFFFLNKRGREKNSLCCSFSISSIFFLICLSIFQN